MAQSLFEAGRGLMDEQRWEEACKRFEESNRLDPSAGTLLNWGRCLELSGRTASAWAMYKRTIAFGKTSNQPRQVAAAEKYLADVEPKLAKVLLVVAQPVPKMVVKAGALELDATALGGVPVAIDPGSYTVVVDAEGYEPWQSPLEVPAGESRTLEIPALKRKPPPPPPPPRKPPPPAASGVGPVFITGLVAGGVGLGALAAGTAFGVLTLDDASTAEEDPKLCPNRRCSAQGLALIDEAKGKATASTALLIGGGALVATSATLLGLSYVFPPASGTLTALAPEPVLGGATLTVRGRW